MRRFTSSSASLIGIFCGQCASHFPQRTHSPAVCGAFVAAAVLVMYCWKPAVMLNAKLALYAACTEERLFATDTVTGGLDLYAKWKPNTYTVTFNHNYTGTTAKGTVANVPHGSTIAAIAAARTGCTLDGWYREAACMTRWIFEADIVTGAHVLYAK